MGSDQTPDEPLTGKTPPLKGVETTIGVIETLETIGPATVTEVATTVGMSKGGTYKHLMTLKQGGLVVQEGKQYRLSFRFLDIGGYLRDHHPGSGLIKVKMQELATETGETSIYSVFENNKTLTLFRETGNQGVSTRTRIGDRHYPHVTAAGKCILSQHPREDIEAIFNGSELPKVATNTITDKDALIEELAEVREQGYAYNRSESVDGLLAIAAPLMPDGRLLGACSITGPEHRMKGDPVDESDPVNENIKSTLLSFVNELEHNIARSHIV